MTDQTKTRFPAPLYAAAGAGDLAYQQLRKLPAVVTELSEKAAASLRTYNEQANAKATQLREKAQTTDFDALRGNAASVATSIAQLAQQRTVAAYTALVNRGGLDRAAGAGAHGGGVRRAGHPRRKGGRRRRHHHRRRGERGHRDHRG